MLYVSFKLTIVDESECFSFGVLSTLKCNGFTVRQSWKSEYNGKDWGFALWRGHYTLDFIMGALQVAWIWLSVLFICSYPPLAFSFSYSLILSFPHSLFLSHSPIFTTKSPTLLLAEYHFLYSTLQWTNLSSLSLSHPLNYPSVTIRLPTV